MFWHTLDFFANLTSSFRFFLHKIYIQSMDKCLTILMKWSNFQTNGLKLTFFTKCWNDENMKAFTHLGQARPIEQNLVCNSEILKYFRKEKLNFFWIFSWFISELYFWYFKSIVLKQIFYYFLYKSKIFFRRHKLSPNVLLSLTNFVILKENITMFELSFLDVTR